MATRSWVKGILGCVLLLIAGDAGAVEHAVANKTVGPRVAEASGEGEHAIRSFRIPKGWKVDLIAAEPDLANPVAFGFDEKERIYVVETFRHSDGVLDIRSRTDWPSEGYRKGVTPERWARMADELLDADLANRSVDDRERMLRHYFAENVSVLEAFSERVKRIERGPDGRAKGSTVFADGFNTLVGGLASGVLARDGDVWFTDIPHLWRLRDLNDDGVSDERVSLSSGYGVRVGFLGHDLHGLRFGPDGRLYFSIGDRGANVVTKEGRRLVTPDTGAVYRCEPDGSELEIFATGLRNPQELVFDDFGNLWTGDNNSDGGDQARWTYLVEGGDSGWHIGWQFIESPNPRGPWNSEGMWRPEVAAKIGHLVPPLANIGAGPSGITFNFGVGLPADLAGRFFMTDFRGGPSGIWSIGVEPKGAGYAVTDAKELLWNMLPTDVEMGPDGGLYWSDWVQGWEKPARGRIYRAYDPEVVNTPEVVATRRWLGVEGMPSAGSSARAAQALGELLGHADQRVRQRAQFRLADAGAERVLVSVLRRDKSPVARRHALWGLGQLARRDAGVVRILRPLLADSDPEIRGQAAKILGDLRNSRVRVDLERMLADPEARPRFFAAIALGRLGDSRSGAALLEMIRRADDSDPYLRHAGVMGLVTTRTSADLAALSMDPSGAVRRAAIVALRRQQSSEVAAFLTDTNPEMILEAARAIQDVPIEGALSALAGLTVRDGLPESVLRRALAANLRAGGTGHVKALAAFAADASRPEALRVEALSHLGQFPEPAGRDAVTGLWRPLPKREPAGAREALTAHFAVLTAAPDSVASAAVRSAGRLDVRGLAESIRAVATDHRRGEAVRVAALDVLGGWADAGLTSVLGELSKDAVEGVRMIALKWQTRLGVGEVLAPLRTALENGSVREKQNAAVNLASVKGDGADVLLAQWLEAASTGKAPAEIELELIEAGRAREDAVVKAALGRFETSLASSNQVLSRRFALRGGDAAKGRKVFFEKDSVQCQRCHKANGVGGVVGPDVALIAPDKSREYLLESIVDPNAFVAQGFENVMVEMRDGTEFAGTVKAETDVELTLNTPENGTVVLRKSDIQDRRRGLSGMPEGLAEILTPRELRDLVQYLWELKAR